MRAVAGYGVHMNTCVCVLLQVMVYTKPRLCMRAVAGYGVH